MQAKTGGRAVKLSEAKTKEAFRNGTNVYFYDAAPNLNRFATGGSPFEKVVMTKNPQLLVKLTATDITQNAVTLTVSGFRLNAPDHLLQATGALTAPLAVVADSNKQAYTLKPSWNKIPHADYYEIDFDGQRYSTIRDTTLLFEGLSPETDYHFKIRAVNKAGNSDWKAFVAKTSINPLEFAIKDILGETSAPYQEDNEIAKLFDFDESDLWHTKWGTKAVPFDLIMDLRSVNQLDKIRYLPRSRGNGILLKGTIAYSADKTN